MHQDGASKTAPTRFADPRWYLTITEKRPPATPHARAPIALRPINAADRHNNDIIFAHKPTHYGGKALLSLWICGQCYAPAGLPWITMKPLSTAPASVHKLHRPQTIF